MARKSTTFVVVSWALVALCAGFIFFMSSNTDTGLNDGLGLFSRIFQDLKALQAQLLGPEVDVVSSIAHFCEYTVLGALLANALRCHMPLRRACLVAVACASLYGASDEFHQLFVPGRMCDPMDWLVDTAGAALGSGLAYLQLRRKGREGKEQPGRGRLRRGMKVGEWSDEARMALRCILHRASPGLVSNSCGVVSSASARRRMTERRGSAVPFSMRFRKGRPTSTIRANFCFVIFACLRRRVTLRPRMTEASFLLSSAA